jgi:hypothetical protein
MYQGQKYFQEPTLVLKTKTKFAILFAPLCFFTARFFVSNGYPYGRSLGVCADDGA